MKVFEITIDTLHSEPLSIRAYPFARETKKGIYYTRVRNNRESKQYISKSQLGRCFLDAKGRMARCVTAVERMEDAGDELRLRILGMLDTLEAEAQQMAIAIARAEQEMERLLP